MLNGAKSLGFRKNEMARSLVTSESNIIGVIMPNVASNFYGDIVSGIEDVSYENGFTVIINHSGINRSRIYESINMMAGRRVDGLIIVSVELRDREIDLLESLNIPYILLSTISERAEAPYIKVDDFEASYAAVKYLIEKGHQSIACIGGNPEDKISGIPRIEGYKKALEESGINIDPVKIQYGDYSFDSGKEAMEKLIKETEITSAFCVSDDVALGGIYSAYASGLNVPNDISIIGYDNSRISYMSVPPLTTVSQPFYEMGKDGCKSVIGAIRNKSKIQSKVIPFEIVERDSVKNI